MSKRTDPGDLLALIRIQLRCAEKKRDDVETMFGRCKQDLWGRFGTAVDDERVAQGRRL